MDTYRELHLLRRLEALLIDREHLRVALGSIKARAFSDAPSEELEDVQRDLRHIYATAFNALAGLKE